MVETYRGLSRFEAAQLEEAHDKYNNPYTSGEVKKSSEEQLRSRGINPDMSRFNLTQKLNDAFVEDL